MSGFENASTETLRTIHANLLKGLDLVSDSLNKGIFHKVGPKGEAPPSQSGNLTLLLLQAIEAELETRND